MSDSYAESIPGKHANNDGWCIDCYKAYGVGIRWPCAHSTPTGEHRWAWQAPSGNKDHKGEHSGSTS